MSFIFLLTFLAACRGDRPGELSSMLTQLAHGASGCEDRILVALDAQGDRGQWVRSQSVLFEHSLRPIFNVLPKTSNRLSEEVARYALHRAFVDGRGWIVKGLEESKVYSNSSTPLQSVLQNEFTEVQEAFQHCHGLGLRELALLAASLDELVHQEVLLHVKDVFKAKKRPVFGHIKVLEMQKILEEVMIGYICDAAGLDEKEKYISGELDIQSRYPDWPNLKRFLRSIQEIVVPTQSTHIDFDDLTNIIKEMNEHYGRWQNGECEVLSHELQGLENQCPGHINLAKFYSSHLYQDKWQFTESVDYLRSLGALEESQKGNPQLVSANYVLGANNCVSSSKFYSQCCLNECDGYLRKLEKAVGVPKVTPDDLEAAVRAMLPEPQASVKKLYEIAKKGKIALHGRALAEWLHHAYPRECPAVKDSDLSDELPGHFESRSGSSSSFSDMDMRSYLETHNPEEASDCRIPWAEEVVDFRRLQEVPAVSWAWAYAALATGSVAALALTKVTRQGPKQEEVSAA